MDDDDESVKLSFGAMPHLGVSAVTPDETTVSITDDDDPEVTVMFGQATYTVDESDDTSTTGVTENTVEMTLTLSADPERTVVIPIETTELDGATGADYSVPSERDLQRRGNLQDASSSPQPMTRWTMTGRGCGCPSGPGRTG